VRIIIGCPESDSPLRGRIHLRGLSFRTTSNLLQSGGGPYIFLNNAHSKKCAKGARQFLGLSLTDHGVTPGV
jgi:hypothetical protein